MADGRESLAVRRVIVAAVCLLSAAAVWAPTDAQPASKIPKIGFLTQTTRDGAAGLVEAFREGMRELGYVEGKTFVLEARFAEGHSERVPELARELVGRKVDVIARPPMGRSRRPNERLARFRS